MLFSWILLAVYSRNEATSTARSHLTFIKQAYQAHSATLKENLEHVATNPDLIAILKQQPATSTTQSHLQSLLVEPFSHNSLAAIALVSSKQQVLAQVSDTTLSAQNLASQDGPLLAQGLQGQTLSSIQRSIPGTGGANWSLSIAIPVRASNGATLGVLLAFQAIDNNFAHQLTQDVGMPTLFCIGGQVQGISGASLQSLSLAQNGGAGKICTAGTSLKLGQRYLTLAEASASQNTDDAAQLVVVAVEPLYLFNGSDPRLLFMIAGIGLFISAWGILAYVFMKHFLFSKPLRQLLAHVQPLVMNTVEQQVEQTDDEITQLTQSFNLLADELENESQAMAEQMSNLLIASDALISTLNLEHLLGEIVTRLGNIMKVKHVSLLLYGREMLSPWAVAQWSEVAGQIVDAHSAPNSLFSHSLQQQGAVTVHADPDADITLAITSKMAAITNARLTKASGKRKAVQGDTAETQSYGLRRPRIPRLAVRDLDQVLSHMVIQRHKIAYGEDIASIDREHQGKWTRMALEAGYRSAIAVPLLLHDQAIGAFMLYTDTPRQISSRDTFLLSTVTAQTAVAIQNALLFAEVKEKNAALERASHLKSQFLANVTHE
ncbi:MAG TPA: GAF domain-containing protein, partial [Ktedonobacteraceae bacterium]|nr:GAF domain-containing protein [Ktedonobacteraceae bacterium]